MKKGIIEHLFLSYINDDFVELGLKHEPKEPTDFIKAHDKEMELHHKFVEQLTDAQRELFFQIEELASWQSAILEKESFIAGFKIANSITSQHIIK